MRIVLVGAGSRSFGPATLRDIWLSEPLAGHGVDLVLMDVASEALETTLAYASFLNAQLERNIEASATTNLDEALRGADFVVCAIERNRYLYWTQDFHVPRHFGFRQPYGENGGIGGLFHALRNMGPMVEIARAMERVCPKAWLLNYSNPEHKLCEAITRLTSTPVVGLCHGVFDGRAQLARILDVPLDDLETFACGINHFTFFETVRRRSTGEDLYPRLRQIDAAAHELSEWHHLGLGRVLFRRFGLWPSPASNHYAEYIRWADEFVASELQFYYDPANGHPWETGEIPEFVYEPTGKESGPRWREEPTQPARLEDAPLKPSGELGVPIIEAISLDEQREIAAVNVPNRGAIPGLPDDLVVEVPATADASGLHARQMAPLPEAIAALIRTQASIHKLLVEAYADESRDKLLQAILLEPTVDSYRRAVAMMDEMLRLQADILPPLKIG
ncbi:MAG: alpha-galactosidase [Verrucomicrobia bacterium]|nr:alpha-galactosidase [Verrucomicrobiota bacterium]